MANGPIIFLLDTSYKMKLKNEHGKTAMESAFIFLLRLCKRSDAQPAYFGRVRISYGNKLIKLETGKAEEQFQKFVDEEPKESNLLDYVSFWKSTFEAEKFNNPSFFVLTAFLDDRTLNLFDKHHKNMLFMDFSGKSTHPTLAKRHQNYEFVDQEDLEDAADDIHKHFLDEYLTNVNVGLPFNAEFYTVSTKHDFMINIRDLKVCGVTTSVPLEGFSILARSFLMPVDNCYNVSETEKSLNNDTAYLLLKTLLGEEPSMEGEENREKEDESEQNDNAAAPVPKEKTPESTEKSHESTEIVSEDVKETSEITKQEDAEKTPVKVEKKRTNRAKATKQQDDADEDDEEYTPSKKRGPKRNAKPAAKRTPAKRAKVVESDSEVTTKRSTRSSTKRKKEEETPEKVKQEPVDEKQTVEEKPPKTENETAGTTEDAKKSEKSETEEKKPEVVEEEVPDPVYLIAHAIERFSEIHRPVILRLRGLYEEDKTFYDEETLKIKAEEAKKAEEELGKETEKTTDTSTGIVGPVIPKKEDIKVEEESPASPTFDEGPASPDMAPNISHSVKIIPTIPTEVAQDVDYRLSTPSVIKSIPLHPVAPPIADEDLRNLPVAVKTIPLEPVATTIPADVDMRIFPVTTAGALSGSKADTVPADVDLRTPEERGQNIVKPSDIAETPESIKVDKTGKAEEPTTSCIADEPEEIEEPSMEEMITNQQEQIKCIPVESELERELKKVQAEAEAPSEEEKNKLYIEVIVLNTSWEQFRTQIGFVGDEKAAELIAEREKTVVGPEPSHDYDKLPGWYSGEAMQFYVNKLIRAIRKLQDRSSLFEKEIENICRIIIYSQSPDYARFFANLIHEESVILPRSLLPVTDTAANYLLQLDALIEFGERRM